MVYKTKFRDLEKINLGAFVKKKQLSELPTKPYQR